MVGANAKLSSAPLVGLESSMLLAQVSRWFHVTHGVIENGHKLPHK